MERPSRHAEAATSHLQSDSFIELKQIEFRGNVPATPPVVSVRRAPEKTGRPLRGNVIRSRGDNEVTMLAGHIQSHGGGWKKCVETPFPLQAVSGPAGQKSGASQAARSGPGTEVCPLVTQPTEAAAPRGRDRIVSIGIRHPPMTTDVHMRSSSPEFGLPKGVLAGRVFFLSARVAQASVFIFWRCFQPR